MKKRFRIMSHGGKRVGAGRPKGKTIVGRAVWVQVDTTDEQVKNVPAMIDLLDHWECEAANSPDSPRYHFLRQLIGELRDLGY